MAKKGKGKVDVSGLSQNAIDKVKSVSDNPQKAARLANALRNRQASKDARAGAGTGATTGAPAVDPRRGIQQRRKYPGAGINSKTGAINPTKGVYEVSNAGYQDTATNFAQNNPESQTDEFGNTQNITRDPVTGAVKIDRQGGGALTGTMDAFNGAIGGFTSDLSSQVANAQNANYSYMTKDLASQKQQELNSKKQELQQRGIPFDNSPDSPYGRLTNDIEKKYQGLDDQARNQSIMLGNDTLTAQSGAQNQTIGTLANTANAFSQNATPFVGADSNQAGIIGNAQSTISGANTNVYGINEQSKANKNAIAASKDAQAKAIAAAKAAQAANSGGSVSGGRAPGWA